ncbi:M81 family metallopeptidase [Salinicola halophyticus]|uniref:M81 family metallopeptidase n=1 Tax=Salinicola halophyticus TaxID=1808881 RepID=UPI003F4507BD
MTILMGSIKQETNSFCDVPATLATFESSYLHYGEEIGLALQGSRTEPGGFLKVLAAHDRAFIPTVAAAAISGGRVTVEAWQTLREAVLEPLRRGVQIEAVLLSLHGAMLTQDSDDPEGDLLTEIRRLAGHHVPIAVSLDPHAHVTEAMLTSADIFLAYKTFPHVDQFETGVQTAELLLEMLEGRVSPVTRSVRLPMLVSPEAQVDSRSPMRDVLDAVRAMEREPGIAAVNYCPVQPWLDIPGTASVISVTTHDDASRAEASAWELSEHVWALRDQFVVERMTPSAAVMRAIDHTGARPLALVESADSTLAGAPGGGVTLLRTLLARQVAITSYVTVVDPQAVAAAMAAGEGQRIVTSVGKRQPDFGDEPVEVDGIVTTLSDGRFRLRTTNTMESMGPTAVIRIGAVHLVVCSNAFAHLDPESYEYLGLMLDRARIVGIKSTLHFRANYADRVDDILLIEDRGVSSGRFDNFDWQYLSRPMWPLDDASRVEAHWRETR